MKIINPSDSVISGILGKQEFNPDKKYIPSKFNTEHEYSGRHLVFNTLTRQMISLSSEENKIIEDIRIFSYSPNKPPEDTADNFIKELIERRFLVPENADELKLANQLKATAAVFGKKGYIKSYTIMTTTDCNARCWYCYELGRSRIPMTAETAEKTARFILDNSKGHKVKLIWFGGEPLFNSEVIDIICGKLRESGKEFVSTMVSNGYLFDDGVILKAKNNWNLKKVQITLDGTEEVYNGIKGYIYKGSNAFKRVTDNIETLLRTDIRVQIRLNIDRDNCGNLSELCDYLINRFSEYGNIAVYTAVIMHYNNGKCIPRTPSDGEFEKEYFKINDKLYNAGMISKRKLSTTLKGCRCMADSDSSAMIAPDGGIGKCEHFSESDFWRTLDDPTVNREILESWKKRVVVEECKSCPHFPMCIKLEKCPDTANVCTEFDREMLNYHLKKQIEGFYDSKAGEKE